MFLLQIPVCYDWKQEFEETGLIKLNRLYWLIEIAFGQLKRDVW